MTELPPMISSQYKTELNERVHQKHQKIHFTSIHSTPKPVCFHDVSYERMKDFFDRAYELLETKHAFASLSKEITGTAETTITTKVPKSTRNAKARALPRIIVHPPTKKELLAAQKTTDENLLSTSQVSVSAQLHAAIHAEQLKKQKKLILKYEEKLSVLKSKISELHTQVNILEKEIILYKKQKHPHFAKHLTIDDLELEIRALEHKLLHFSKREQKYMQLAKQISQAKTHLELLQNTPLTTEK